MKATYQTRIETDPAAGRALSAYAQLYGHVERRLFVPAVAGEPFMALKRGYLVLHGISSSQFNSVKVSLEGKVKAVQATQKLRIDGLKRRIAKAEKTLAKLAKKGLWFQVHHKRRRLETLRGRLRVLEVERQAGLVRLCFGSRPLWRKQYDLEAGGYANHEAWLADWRDARRGEFFVMGSRDETAGCQLCVAAVSDDGSLTLRLRMPDSLAGEHGKYVTIEGVRFAYGHEQVLAALESNTEYAEHRREHGEKAARGTNLGQAVSYRFKRDAKGWRVFVTTETVDVRVVTDRKRGAIGVDLNADHLAVAETDASGNYVHAFRVPLVTYGKSRHQAEALIGDAVARVVDYAKRIGKPIVIEALDFRKKKAALEGESRKYNRMLSSFSYGKTQAYFLSRGHRAGVEIRQVNPAFSSVIGRVKFMERYGLSVHQAAALVLARRLVGYSERIPCRWVAPTGNGGRVAFRVPVRKRAKHVWTYWGAISGQLRPALAAHHRLGKSRDRPNPIQACVRASARGDSLGGDPFGVSGRDSRTESPCTPELVEGWGGGAATPASLEMVWQQSVTKVNHFLQRFPASRSSLGRHRGGNRHNGSHVPGTQDSGGRLQFIGPAATARPSRPSPNTLTGGIPMTPLEAPIHACTSRRRSALLGTLIIFAALALPCITELQAQEWRFEAIDRRFDQQEGRFKDIDRRFNRLDQQIHRLHQRLWDHSMSQLPLWGTKGAVDALRDVVRGLQKEVAYLRQLIEPPQPSRPLPADIRRLPL